MCVQHQTDPWLTLADKLARLDRPLPLYHRALVWAWAWAITRSLRSERGAK